MRARHQRLESPSLQHGPPEGSLQREPIQADQPRQREKVEAARLVAVQCQWVGRPRNRGQNLQAHTTLLQARQVDGPDRTLHH